MEEVKNDLVDHEEKTEGKSLKKPKNTAKAEKVKAEKVKAEATKAMANTAEATKSSTKKASEAKVGKTKAVASDGDIRNIKENEQEMHIPVYNINKTSIENTDLDQIADNIEISKKNDIEHQEETEKTIKDVTQDEEKKKNPKKRKLCKLIKKDFLKKHFKEYEELVLNPGYICGKCGRVAKDAKSLCKPMLIEE
jgi:hypothetical protein